MRIFQHWVTEKVRISIAGEMKEIRVYGGSNVSLDDATSKARQKAELIQRKINGEENLFEDYEVEIREELVRRLDDKNAITRNRYGAQVLNAENLLILDIDQPKSAGLAGLFNLFKKKAPESEKEKIFAMIREKAAKSEYADFGFRVYETFQGARVIVTGRDFDARDSFTKALMKDFNTDPLYAAICARQGCFRARLTPKPYRMKLKGYRVKYPREAGDDAQFQNWLQTYERISRDFSVCRFVELLGRSYGMSAAIRLHDDLSGAGARLPLA
ncbi:MAG: hypothetical protein LC099_05480 [Anaerolineales bacterium]|nr:hypothetical protein [Anaerolineales bacterium]